VLMFRDRSLDKNVDLIVFLNSLGRIEFEEIRTCSCRRLELSVMEQSSSSCE
jgi:hypothetical protein